MNLSPWTYLCFFQIHFNIILVFWPFVSSGLHPTRVSCAFIFSSMPIVLPASLVFFDLIIWPTFGEHTNCKDSLHAVIFWIFSSAHRFKCCNSMRVSPLMWETKFHTHIHVSFKMFPESLYFWEKQNITIIYAKFPSKRSPCAAIHICQRLWNCWKHSCKSFCESLFSFSFAFLMISLASQKYRPFSGGFSQEKR